MPATPPPEPSAASLEQAIAANLSAVQSRIAAAAGKADRSAASVTLIAISKAQPEARIQTALALGHRVFGENRVQEATARWPALREAHPDLELHLVGPLQTNKAGDAVKLFDVLHSLDRPKLAAALALAMAKSGVRRRCLVQVNTGEEPQKSGVAPAEADSFIAACRDDHGLPVAGLMCIPPAADDPAPHFALLAEIARRAGLPLLSMGMSADYEVAVRLGATHVRVGTAVFGPRPTARTGGPARGASG